MSLLIIISLYFVTSILLKNSIDFFSNSSFLDYPTNRSNHNVPKPKCAGLILIPLIINVSYPAIGRIIFNDVNSMFESKSSTKENLYNFISTLNLTLDEK